ncbi:MAG TPA: MFS transporter [Alphaproteobacteria bacterium]|nr:MFS transporter [Alphaproteobacteria bacterium]
MPVKRLLKESSLTLAAMSLGYGVVQLDVTIVNVAVNAIGSAFHGNMAALQWVVSSYTITFAAFILSAGALGDRIGAKRVFVAGFALFTVASLVCAAAPTLPILIIARAVQGAGAAVLVPNSLALLNHAYEDSKERARAVAFWASGASFTLTLGPLVGGVLIKMFGWRSIFLVNLPLGLLGLWLTMRYAKETPGNAVRRIDLPGQITAVLALGVLAWSLIRGGEVGWTHPQVLLGISLAIVMAAVFIGIDHYSDHPMLPLGMFKNRTFRASTITGVLVNIAFYGLIFVFSLYFQRAHQLSPLWTGMAFVPMTGACFIANLNIGRISARFGDRKCIVAGTAIILVGCLAILGIGADTNYGWLLPSFILMGGGLGTMVPPLTHALLSSVDKARSGIASGVLTASRQTGSVLGVSLFGSLIATAPMIVHGTRISLAISAGVLLASCIIELIGMATEKNE